MLWFCEQCCIYDKNCLKFVDSHKIISLTHRLIKKSQLNDHFFISELRLKLKFINPYRIIILYALKFSSAFFLCCIYSSTLQTRYFHGSKTMNTDQTALKGGV